MANFVCGVEIEWEANGPSKTMGLVKFSSNFTGHSRGKVFAAVLNVSQSRFFFKANKVSKY